MIILYIKLSQNSFSIHCIDTYNNYKFGYSKTLWIFFLILKYILGHCALWPKVTNFNSRATAVSNFLAVRSAFCSQTDRQTHTYRQTNWRKNITPSWFCGGVIRIWKISSAVSTTWLLYFIIGNRSREKKTGEENAVGGKSSTDIVKTFLCLFLIIQSLISLVTSLSIALCR